MSIDLFIIGHEPDSLHQTCRRLTVPHHPINLNAIGLTGDISLPTLSESRFYLSEEADKVTADYVGLFTYRYAQKFNLKTSLNEVHQLPLAPDTLWAAQLSGPDWMGLSEIYHKGMGAILDDMAERYDLCPAPIAPWCNNYIVHRSHYFDMLPRWRSIFHDVHQRYGFDFPFVEEALHICWRKPGLLYERLTMMLLSSVYGLRMLQIP